MASDRLASHCRFGVGESSAAKDLDRVAAKARALCARAYYRFGQVTWDDRKRRTPRWQTGVVQLHPGVEDGEQAVNRSARTRHKCARIGDPLGTDHVGAEQFSSRAAPRDGSRYARRRRRSVRASSVRIRFTATDEHNDHQERGLSHTLLYYAASFGARERCPTAFRRWRACAPISRGCAPFHQWQHPRRVNG